MSGALLIFLALAAVVLVPLLVVGFSCPTAPRMEPVAGHVQFLRFSDGSLRFQDEGSGSRALLLLHGFNGQMGDWNAMWERLGNCATRRVRLDLPGFGESEWRSDDYSLAAQGQRVIDFLDARGIERVVVVGGSMGGSLTAWLAAHHPARVDSTAMLAPSGFTGALRYPGVFGWLLQPGPRAKATKLARGALFRALFPRSKALQAFTVTASYGPPWVADLGRIQAPTLLLWSKGDLGVSYTTAHGVQRAITGSELVWLDADTGHLIPRERPDLVAAAACALAQGAAPRAAAESLRPLARPGDFTPPPAG